MNDVAEEAGIAVGTLYRYFDDKQKLETELIARMLVIIVERIEQTHDPEAKPPERLDGLLRAVCEACLDHLGALTLFLARSTWGEIGTDHGIGGDARPAYLRYIKIEDALLTFLNLEGIHKDTAVIFLRASLMAGLTRLAGANAQQRRKRIAEIIQLTTRGLLGCAS